MRIMILVIIIFYTSIIPPACNAELVSKSEDGPSASQINPAKDNNVSPVVYENINYNHEHLQYEKIISDQNEVIAKLISSLQTKQNEKTGMDYSAWVSILLGCVGVIITVVSVVVAIISFVGYRNFEKKIETSVRSISSKVALEETTKQLDIVAKKELVRLINDGALNKHLQDAVNIVFLRVGNPVTNAGFNKYPEIDLDEEDKP
ncbi:hypothetical protein [Dickeya chrysanthemi]|uniref:hypothetical protein n=1 Tax=Dickeya chrysanthemi TaxID=556 RepID=UPI001CF3E215|nr:hypothetical protein [Dickeya chrysanthemi]MCA7008863.1 hypothetical protein [Dickeya chrysanthemi]